MENQTVLASGLRPGRGPRLNSGPFCGHLLRPLSVIPGVNLPYDVSKINETISSSSDDILLLSDFFPLFCLIGEQSIISTQQDCPWLSGLDGRKSTPPLLSCAFADIPHYTMAHLLFSKRLQCFPWATSCICCLLTAWYLVDLFHPGTIAMAAAMGRTRVETNFTWQFPVLYHRGGRLTAARPTHQASFKLRFRPHLKLPRDSRPLRLGHTVYAQCVSQGNHDASALLRQYSSESPFRPSLSRSHGCLQGSRGAAPGCAGRVYT